MYLQFIYCLLFSLNYINLFVIISSLVFTCKKINIVFTFTVDLKIPITMHIISRSFDDPIFSNKPQPMWAVCPEWIRPGTVIYTLQALDLKYGATDIVYNLESGRLNLLGILFHWGMVFKCVWVGNRDATLSSKQFEVSASSRCLWSQDVLRCIFSFPNTDHVHKKMSRSC